MPRYFFDTHNGRQVCDDEGTELRDHSAVRKHAIVFAGEVMHNDPAVLWDGRNFSVEVWDESHTLLFTVRAFATNSPAGGDTR